jgi:hypothetical protein
MVEFEQIMIRFWRDLIQRPSGPMAFRFVLQPVMSAIQAVRDGLKDARTGRSPYFWTVLNDPERRRARLVEGLKSTSRIILLGCAMDCVYQYKVLGAFHPREMVAIALGLAFVPYLLLRGPVNRIACWWSRKKSASRV